MTEIFTEKELYILICALESEVQTQEVKDLISKLEKFIDIIKENQLCSR